jgi:hypothetical protein
MVFIVEPKYVRLGSLPASHLSQPINSTESDDGFVFTGNVVCRSGLIEKPPEYTCTNPTEYFTGNPVSSRGTYSVDQILRDHDVEINSSVKPLNQPDEHDLTVEQVRKYSILTKNRYNDGCLRAAQERRDEVVKGVLFAGFDVHDTVCGIQSRRRPSMGVSPPYVLPDEL